MPVHINSEINERQSHRAYHQSLVLYVPGFRPETIYDIAHAVWIFKIFAQLVVYAYVVHVWGDLIIPRRDETRLTRTPSLSFSLCLSLPPTPVVFSVGEPSPAACATVRRHALTQPTPNPYEGSFNSNLPFRDCSESCIFLSRTNVYHSITNRETFVPVSRPTFRLPPCVDRRSYHPIFPSTEIYSCRARNCGAIISCVSAVIDPARGVPFRSLSSCKLSVPRGQLNVSKTRVRRLSVIR